MARWLENSNSPSAVCKTLLKDQSYFYHRDNLLPFMLTLGASSVLAHTTMDQEFADWYQDDVRSKFSDDASSFAKVFGEQWIVVPIYVGASLFGRACDVDYRVQTWGDRSFRSMLVGVPPLLLLQRSLGSSRPNDPLASSNWDMWNDDNGASGHAFVGAVPFLVAAQLTEKRVPKASFYVLSTMTAWSRINDNDHYLSQVIVGWWVALAATNAVQKSDSRGNLQIQPAFINQDGGAALSYKY